MKVSEYLNAPESPLRQWARDALRSWQDYEIIVEPYDDLGFFGATTAKWIPCDHEIGSICVVVNKHDNSQKKPWFPSDSIFLTESQFAKIAEMMGYRKE